MLKDFLRGLVKIHILHHAGQRPVYGLWLIEELRRHGYRLSPGTLYPTLRGLEQSGYLTCARRIVGGKVRKYYLLTSKGREVLDAVRPKVLELMDELSAGSAEFVNEDNDANSTD